MSIDFSLAPKISGSDYLGPLQAMELGRKAQRDALTQQTRDTALKQYSAGDSAGAQKTAVSGGDFDLAQHLTQVDEAHKQQLAQVYDTALRTAYSLKALPPEQRQAVFDAQAPRLQAMGVPAEVIAQQRQHLDDAGLDAVAQQSMSVLDQIKTHYEQNKPVSVAPGAQLVNPSTGAVVANNPGMDKIVSLGNGSYIVQHPDGSYGQPAGGGAAGAVGAAPSATAGGDVVARMLPITVNSESGGNPNAVSPKGARGIMQVMPGTNVAPGFGVAPARDGSPQEQARVGQDYLAAMVQRYGDPAKAWAAYNAGPGRVDAAIQSGGSNWLQQLPRETRVYVARNVAQLGQGTGSPTAPGSNIEFHAGPAKAQPVRMTPQEVAAEGLPANKVYYRGTDGVPKPVEGQPGQKAPTQLTESQSKAVSLLNTVIESTNALNTIKGYNPSVLAMGLNSLSSGNPIRETMSQTDRRALNAQLAFAGAVLRLESGAAVSKQEQADKAKTLFPLPGDGPDVQADKRALREAAIRGLRTVAGPGSAAVPTAVAAGSTGNARNAVQAGPPPAAIEHLRSNPNLRAAFDAKFGAGAAARVLGR